MLKLEHDESIKQNLAELKAKYINDLLLIYLRVLYVKFYE